MYCPNCGQQQISDEMRFCSRCGLALSGLAEWLARGGVPAKVEDKPKPDSPRRKNMRRAAKLMFFSVALFPLFLLISIVEDKGEPLIFPFALFFASLAWMLYARLFSDKNAPLSFPATAAQTTTLGSNPVRSALPAGNNIPIPDMRRQQVRTNELAEPPSVTENTTRLLDNE
ncbi:MAG TPA: zinc ribbon domain-containing protein [Pyrinomonadaceae bacterium]|nr:zinc ribbon domain-containing protein [Pyrinomonadaceae bacterium]